MSWLTWIIVLLVALVVFIIILQNYYFKSTKERALVRTGAGGQKVVLDGGIFALPFLHRIEEINMRTQRMHIHCQHNLITQDKLRMEMEVEFHVRVAPNAEGVATAAQSFGMDVLQSESLDKFLYAPMLDAIQASVAMVSMETLHQNRGDFVKKIKAQLHEDLQHVGLLMESVSITRIDQASFAQVAENNAFNAVGMRNLAEIVSNHKKKRIEIEADADVSVRQTQLNAFKRKLDIEREQQVAQLQLDLVLTQAKVEQNTQMVRSQEEAKRLANLERIHSEFESQKAEFNKQKELEQIKQENELQIQVLKVQFAMQLAEKQIAEIATMAQVETAKSGILVAQEQTKLAQEKQAILREKEIAHIRVGKDNELALLKAQTQASIATTEAQAQAEVQVMQAQTEKTRMELEALGRAALIGAENTTSERILLHKIEIQRLQTMPKLAEQLVKPAEKIESIKINHFSGFGQSANGMGVTDSSPSNQIVNSILDLALRMPVMDKIGHILGDQLQSKIPPSKDQ
ncbi:MAG: flotillin domain-containing protein [Gammaproteobacteria bacterium]|nr:flotillin domain-containing protein [Gammaproteobacteria bacterium]